MSDYRGLYIHVPFCLRKCPYCDFYSVAGEQKLYPEYAGSVIRNLRHYPEAFDTVYFGGGTPSLISEYIGDILSALHTAPGAEISMECNPATMDGIRFDRIRKSGVNRLSIGVQSLQDGELKKLGRLHSAAQAEEIIMAAHHAGFENISADIMLGIPGQTADSLSDTLKRLAALPIHHISAYMLTLEPATPFGKSPPKDMADDEQMADLYALCQQVCEENGFRQYEISNYSKSGMECRHNLKYWHDEEYLGIGPAAHSFYDGRRFAVPRDLESFLHSQRQPTELTDDDPGSYDERVMMGLRLSEGIPESLYKPFESALQLIPQEYYTLKNGRLALTSAGFPLYNYIVSLLLAHIKE